MSPCNIHAYPSFSITSPGTVPLKYAITHLKNSASPQAGIASCGSTQPFSGSDIPLGLAGTQVHPFVPSLNKLPPGASYTAAPSAINSGAAVE